MSKAPKLRFKEFSGDWEEKKLGELGEFKNGINKSKGDIIFISFSQIPISSHVSLIAVSNGCSSFSILPPGKQISLGWLRSVLALISNKMWGSSL